METSTAPTRPPPASLAVPVTVIGPAMLAPSAGAVKLVVGGVVSVDALAATSPLCRVVGCVPKSANRFTVACCMRTSAGSLAAVVLVVESPGPLYGAGAEHQRAARVAVQREVMGGGARVVGRAVVLDHGRFVPSRRRQPHQPRRARAVVDVLVPLVAQRVGPRRRRLSRAECRDAGVAPEAQLAVGLGHLHGVRAAVDGEDRAGERRSRGGRRRRWAEARVAPGAGPHAG